MAVALEKRLAGHEVEILQKLQDRGGYPDNISVKQEYGVSWASESWDKLIPKWEEKFHFKLERNPEAFTRLPHSPHQIIWEKTIRRLSVRERLARLQREDEQLKAEIDEQYDLILNQVFPALDELKIDF